MVITLDKKYCVECNKTLGSHNKSGLCRSCGKLGSRNPSFKHGKCKEGAKCVDCGKSIYYESTRCESCSNKGKLNPGFGMFGKYNPNYKTGKNHCKCGKIINYGYKQCSNCYQSNLYGSNNPNWRGGIAQIGKRIRSLKVYKEWYNACLERDNHTCTKCGSKENLEVHHKLSIKKIIKENNIKNSKEALEYPEFWMLELGITYCYDCHCLVDKARYYISQRRVAPLSA